MKLEVLTVGVFDYFHYGHLRLFLQIKQCFPSCYLTVAVQESEYVKRFKPEANIFYPTETRCELIRSLRPVDNVITYRVVDEIVSQTKFDIFAIGEDQQHAGFQWACEYCLANGRRVVRMNRTPNISSSHIKQNLEFRRPDENH